MNLNVVYEYEWWKRKGRKKKVDHDSPSEKIDIQQERRAEPQTIRNLGKG